MIVGPRNVGKSLLINRLIGDYDLTNRTYIPENHCRFFMNSFRPKQHKYILFDNFNVKAFDTTLLLVSMDSHSICFKFPTFQNTKGMHSKNITRVTVVNATETWYELPITGKYNTCCPFLIKGKIPQ